MDAPVNEPQPTASHPEKPAVTRPRKGATTKKTNTTRQTKRKGAKPEPVPPHTTALATPPNHATGDGGESDSGPAADSSTPVVKKAPQPQKQGTRSSARIRGKNQKAIPEPAPAPIKSKNKREKRKQEPDGKNNVAELPEKKPRLDEEEETPVQADVTAPSDGQPVDLSSNENATADYLEQSADVQAEDSGDESPYESPYTAEERELLRHKRFYIREDRGVFMLALG